MVSKNIKNVMLSGFFLSVMTVVIVIHRQIVVDPSTNTNRTGMMLRRYDDDDGQKGLVYIYDIPDEVLQVAGQPPCRGFPGMYELEWSFLDLLKSGNWTTNDPDRAALFWVPHCFIQQYFNINLTFARTYFENIITYIKQRHPFWNRTKGDDHVITHMHDAAYCALGNPRPEYLEKSRSIQFFSDINPFSNWPCYKPDRDVVVPNRIATDTPHPDLQKEDRIIMAFFSGTIFPIVQTYDYSQNIRQELYRFYQRDNDIVVLDHHVNNYTNYLLNSQFCLCLPGWQPWSPRLFDALYHGCIPVIISERQVLPFPQFVEWERFSIRLPPSAVYSLKVELSRYTSTHLRWMREEMLRYLEQLRWDKNALSNTMSLLLDQ